MKSEKCHEQSNYKWQIIWRNVFFLSYCHLAAIYGVYLLPSVKFWTILWFLFLIIGEIISVTAGTHRLWSHRSYNAKWPLKLFFMIFHTIAAEMPIYDWVRNHRAHHKFVDTDADPHNSHRGFFFTHIGWLLVRKHPSVIAKGATLNYTDLDQEPLVVFQKKWYLLLMPLCCFYLPTVIPWLIWNENLWYSWHLNLLMYCLSLNIAFSGNSISHKWGTKPYDKSISSTNNLGMHLFTFGEGWHNYHHSFPWDYRSGELGDRLNICTAFINFCAYLGLAYDLKIASTKLVKQVLRNNESK